MNAHSRRKVRRARARQRARWDALGMSGIMKVLYSSGWTREELLGPQYSLPTVECFVPVRPL